MTVNQDLLMFATGPTQHLTSAALLRQLTGEARETVVDTLAMAIVRVDALELADLLAGEPLQKAREAAVEPTAAVAAAQKALAKAEDSALGRVVAYMKAKRADTAAPDDREPARVTPQVQALREALEAADAAAFVAAAPLRYHVEQIEGLRGAPTPDRETLAVLAAALKGVHDVDR